MRLSKILPCGWAASALIALPLATTYSPHPPPMPDIPLTCNFYGHTPERLHLLNWLNDAERLGIDGINNASSIRSRRSLQPRYQPEPFEIETYFHIVTNMTHLNPGGPNDRNYASLKRTEDQFRVLQNSFDNKFFRFRLAGTTITVNNEWAQSDMHRSEMMSSLHQGNFSTLNVYFTLGVTPKVEGEAHYPNHVTSWHPNITKSSPKEQYNWWDGAQAQTSTMPTDPGEWWARSGSLLVHEVGHWLGLIHTFGQGPDYGCDTLLNGDQVDDTPFHNGPSTSCLSDLDTCPSLPGLDPVRNYMNYVPDACRTEFTDGQYARMTNVFAMDRLFQGKGGYLPSTA